jgi:agmatinase
MSNENSADGMKRRDFLGAAAAGAALGGLASSEASGQQSNAKAGTAAAPGDAGQLYKRHAPKLRGHDHALPDLSQFAGTRNQKAEGTLPSAYYEKEKRRIKELGLEPADSIQDKSDISCFQRGSSPHWSGINTFLKLPYLEDVRKVGEYDVAFVGAPFDIGCTFRSGTRFGPQGMRRISALYQKYSFEHGLDLSETLAMCDVGDIFCPADITKGHDQITKGIAHILSQGTLPMIMGGDHSIGFPIARAVAQCVEGKVGIIHLDRHVDTQEKDMDEIMHTCP